MIKFHLTIYSVDASYALLNIKIVVSSGVPKVYKFNTTVFFKGERWCLVAKSESSIVFK